MRIVNFILAIMFLAFAFLQLNDPDPVIWILIYGAMAVVSIMAIFEFYPLKFIIGLTVVYVGYSLLYIPGVVEWLQQDDRSALFSDVAKMEHLYIEESREFLGLMICVAVLIFYWMRATKFSKR
ncbi:transmembrane 220 family protein [Chryseolinea lacunae]|uniref:Transmembrane 220 family protein n=1 Tax=Chryseolinea lacunae TaxID=2801331 RepID=A0ABS1KWR1_9BACT|nr:transmembrane 220 family protein [Chryseolinea lacunae]MBL0743652.1 transmembrane 220 family protein [Chryseolinea lacunae]